MKNSSFVYIFNSIAIVNTCLSILHIAAIALKHLLHFIHINLKLRTQIFHVIIIGWLVLSFILIFFLFFSEIFMFGFHLVNFLLYAIDNLSSFFVNIF